MNHERSRGKAGRAVVSVLAILLLAGGPVGAVTYTNTGAGGPYGNGGNWMTASTWTPLGTPGSGDTVNLVPNHWPAGLTLTCDAGWGASVVNVTANDGNDCNLTVAAPGTVGTLSWNDTYNFYSWKLNVNSGAPLTLTQFSDIGPYMIRASGALDARWNFTGAAGIQYNTNNFITAGNSGTVPRTANQYAGMLDFSAATSVHLQRNPASTVLGQEVISTWSGSNNAWLITIGRADDGIQNWSVGAGAQPALMPGGSSQDAGIRKVGLGDVHMENVDLIFDLTSTHGADDGKAISGDSKLWGPAYSGTVYANSLAVTAAAATTTRRELQVLGRLVLDGQTGLQAGGTGSGRAVNVVTGNYDTYVKMNSGYWGSTSAFGTLEAAPGASEFYFGSSGTGKVRLNVCNDSRDAHGYINTPTLIANTLHLGPTAYIDDKNDWTGAVVNSGLLEFRGRFVNESTQNALWLTEKSTFRAIGGAGIQSFEAPSADYGLAGPGSGNYLIDRLVFGQDSAGGTGMTWLHLDDAFGNAPGAGAEAVYVNTLELYDGSLLELRGLNLYYRNSGAWQLAVASALVPFAYGDGTGFILVPEPATGAVLALACLLALRRRRRA